MKIDDNGEIREMTKEEIAEYQKEISELETKSSETLEELKTKAVEMQEQLSDLLAKINRLESEGQADVWFFR